MTAPIPRILITAGEPAGIGPDIVAQLAQTSWPAELVVIADPTLLTTRARQLGLTLHIKEANLHADPSPHIAQTIAVLPVPLNAKVAAGVLEPANAPYVIQTLKTAHEVCQTGLAQAIVTGPVHKAMLNDAGIPFSGHTEFFREQANVPHTVMLFVIDQLKVALVTTHLPLAKVPQAITSPLLEQTLRVLHQGLKRYFKLDAPRIAVAGLNPHAGEGGYLGREEIEIITPCLDHLRKEGWHLIGPLPADTLFTPLTHQEADAFLAMYHDQALPTIKALGFDRAVNVTLGLPYLRTSVDHGTALPLAGTGRARAENLAAAVKLTLAMI